MSAAGRCPRETHVRELLARREDDTLTREDARQLTDHLSACPACARKALRSDSTLLFSSLSASRGTASERAELESDTRRVAVDVLAAVEVHRAGRRLQPERRKVVLRAASVALLAGGLIGVLMAKGPGWPFGRKSADASAATAATSPVRKALPPDERTASARSATPLIENLRNPGARIYEYAAESPKEPSVVFIVDRNADI